MQDVKGITATKIIAWGSYDRSKPRVRLLLDELRKQGSLEAEINVPVWSTVRDKAVAGSAKLFKTALVLLVSYPSLLAKLVRQPPKAAVLLPYPAIPDIFVVWPIAKMFRRQIIFDAFISVYDTVVTDRHLTGAGSLQAKILWIVEWLALRLADVILVDTDQHGDFFSREFGIDRRRSHTVLVGAEPAFWKARNSHALAQTDMDLDIQKPIVLFYGQLIPLHGVETILEAIGLTSADAFHWLVVGEGQEETTLRDFLDVYAGNNVTWIPWVAYDELPALIRLAAVGLGVFGTSDKAARVIPNKAFQILAAGRPLITRESPAIDRLAERYPSAIRTVPPGNGVALANTVREAISYPDAWRPLPAQAENLFGPNDGVKGLLARLVIN